MSNYKISLEIEKLKEMGVSENIASIVSYSKNGKFDEALDHLQIVKDEHEFLFEQIKELGLVPLEHTVIKPTVEGEFILKNNIE